MWRVTIKGLLGKKLRLVLTSIAVVLGVAFMSGTFVLTDTLGRVFDDLFSQQARDTDAVVRTKQELSNDDAQGGFVPRNPVPETLLPTVESAEGARFTSGSVFNCCAAVVGKDGDIVQNGGAPTFGLSWPAKEFAGLFKLQAGSPPSSADEVAIDKDTASTAKMKIGDEVRVVFTTSPARSFTVSGIFEYGDAGLAGATFAAFEMETAQEVMNRVGQFDTIDVKAEPGISPEEMVRNIRVALRDAGEARGLEVKTAQAVADETADDIKQGLSFFNTFLLVFAFIALFVGAFIIYNTFSIIVAQRSRELALLRAIGASGKQVKRSVSLEALVVGLLSSVIGLLLGVFVAIGLEALLSAFGLSLPSHSPVILPRTVIVAIVVGTLVTYVSAVAPARRAAKVAPVAAMRDTPVVLGGGNGRYRIGFVLLAVGLALLAFGLFGPSPSGVPGGRAGLVGIAATLVFIGVAMVSPLVARPVSSVLGWAPARFRGMSGVLARENAMRNPRRTATTASALMIGLALITLVSIFGASAKKSFTSIIDDSVRADFIVTAKGFGGGNGFTPDVASQISDQLPSAAVVEFRNGFFRDPDGSQKPLTAAPADIEQALKIDLRPTADLDAFADDGVLLYKNTAEDLKAKVGDDITMTFEKTGPQQVTVQGIFDENRTVGVNYLLSLADFETNFTDQVDSLVAVKVGADESTHDARRAINGVLKDFPNLQVEDQAEFKASRLAQFDTILNLLYVMLLLAVVIALIGIVNTLALSIYERTREIGLLRAVGMTRKQVKRMVRDEAVIISIFGSFLGLVIGLLFGAALVSAIGEGVTFTIPFGQLALFVILAGVAGLLAGMWPARRAAHHNVLDAIEA